MQRDRLPHPVHVSRVDTVLGQQRGNEIRALHLQLRIAAREVTDP
ncbi:hypothetical protein [Actinopolymorpha pittospori]|uniref:Uncharacterized protein n=1 Tax=Actinopolymorpha pittospori TaxID=648752 RepID=A0A927MNV6_9ACTN|nr:hypothetical protein [Actinopolymorpha pittospori]MBE1604145.1 hypothetical protein [Actinopolymorpha pittospori]